MAYGVKAY